MSKAINELPEFCTCNYEEMAHGIFCTNPSGTCQKCVPAPNAPVQEGKAEEKYRELFEEYKDLVREYCIVISDVEIRFDKEQGFYLNSDLKQCSYILAGNIDMDSVVEDIVYYDFDKLDKEGLWNIQFLLKWCHGDESERSYLDILYAEPCFCMTFEEKEKQDKELEEFNANFSF